VPTPTVSFETIRRKAMGAINFTASHNPPEYNGLKFSTANGAPALPEVTKAIEREIHALQERNEKIDVYAKTELIENIDPKDRYLGELRNKIDVDAIRKSGLRIAIDSLYGTARDYLDYFLLESGVELKIIHNYRDPYFGGFSPECNEKNLGELRKIILAEKFDLGLATDGDADRFGIVDADGKFLPPNYVIAVLFDYLVESRGWKNGVAKSVATTNLINALAQHHEVELHETPVGFKYIGELIMQDKIAIGGEESAGLSIRHHVPEKDGVLAGLLCCEAVARRGKSLGEQLKAISNQVGSYFPERQNFRLTPEVKAKFTEKLKSDPRDFCGHPVGQVVRTDGLKLVFSDGSWVCYRLSGTESVVRVYTEARSEKGLEKLSTAAKHWIFE
jgi:phosphoglucomutase